MFCPNCKAEYQQGYTRCSDCDVPLVDTLPEESHGEVDPDARFIKLFETNDQTDISVVKSILDGAGIRYFFQNDLMSVIYPFIQPAALMVLEEDVARTVDLLKDVKLNYLRMFFAKNE